MAALTLAILAGLSAILTCALLRDVARTGSEARDERLEHIADRDQPLAGTGSDFNHGSFSR